jgi:hypothetical protein
MISDNKSMRAVVATLGLLSSAFLTAASAEEDTADFAAPLHAEYERPGVDWSKYDKLIINDLDVSRTKIVPPPWKDQKAFRWEVSEKNVAALQEEYHKSMEEQISGDDGFEIVTEPGDGVIDLTLEILSFMPYADRDEKVLTKGSGEMHINVMVRDARTGQLLAIMEGPQEVGNNYDENTDFSRRTNVKMLFDSWGARVRIAMDRDAHQH